MLSKLFYNRFRFKVERYFTVSVRSFGLRKGLYFTAAAILSLALLAGVSFRGSRIKAETPAVYQAAAPKYVPMIATGNTIVPAGGNRPEAGF